MSSSQKELNWQKSDANSLTTLKMIVVIGYPKPLNQEKVNVNESVWIPENLCFCQLNILIWYSSHYFRFKIQSIVHLGSLG